jgi:hypothetical protein
VTGVRKARGAVEARKRAVYDNAAAGGHGEDIVRLFLLGFDVDQGELAEAVVPIQRAAKLAYLSKAASVEELAAGAFLDGLLVGLFLARHRNEATPAAPADLGDQQDGVTQRDVRD